MEKKKVKMEYYYQTGALTRPEIYQGTLKGLVLQTSTRLSLKHDAIIFQQWLTLKEKKCSSTKRNWNLDTVTKTIWGHPS